MTTIRGREIDPTTVTGVRAGNALWPGLTTFTGLSFLVYLLIKLATGALQADAGAAVQIGASALLLAVGGRAMARARYFRVTVETTAGPMRFDGLSKAEQREIMTAVAPAAPPPERAGA